MALEQSNLFNSPEPNKSFFSDRRKFFIVGNSNRSGVTEATEDIKRRLNITAINEKPNSFEFVDSAQSIDEIYHNLVKAGIENVGNNERALIGIGGDGGQSDYFETARTYFNGLVCVVSDKVGSAKDLYWNLSRNNISQEPTELNPLEFTINDIIYAAYNVGSVGRSAEIAKSINDLSRSSSPHLQLIKNSLVTVKKLPRFKTFIVTTANGMTEDATDLILTNSQRFGLVFHSRQNNIYDKTAGEHLLTNITPFLAKFILSAVSLYEFTPNRYFDSNDSLEYLIEGEDIHFQRDGESIELPNKTNISVKIAEKPVHVLTI